MNAVAPPSASGPTSGRLDGQVALVTGGSSGIGLAIAARLAQQGATVAVVASRDPAKAAAAAESLCRQGGRAEPFVADLRDGHAARLLAEAVARSLGPIDLLVNSAGVWYATPLASITEAQIDEMMNVNLHGTIRMVRALAPSMMERRRGRIVNLASIAGLVPSGGFSLYSTAKAGIVAFTKAASLELAPYDVAINAIAPGNTATPMNEAVRQAPELQGRRDWIASITPSNRSFTPPEEIAETALFLLDGRVRGIHGATLCVDEGRSAGLAMREGPAR